MQDEQDIPSEHLDVGVLEYASGGYERPRRSGRSITLLEGLIILSIIVVLVGILLPATTTHHPRSKRTACLSNLRQLGTAMVQYASTHNRQFPDSFETLIRSQKIDPRCFVCPMCKDTPASGATTQQLTQSLGALGRPDAYATAAQRPVMHVSYILCPGLMPRKGSSQQVLAYEPLCNHTGTGINVLFADGHVAMRSAAAATALIKSLSPTTSPCE